MQKQPATEQIVLSTLQHCLKADNLYEIADCKFSWKKLCFGEIGYFSWVLKCNRNLVLNEHRRCIQDKNNRSQLRERKARHSNFYSISTLYYDALRMWGQFFFIKLEKAFTNSTNLGSAHAKMPL